MFTKKSKNFLQCHPHHSPSVAKTAPSATHTSRRHTPRYQQARQTYMVKSNRKPRGSKPSWRRRLQYFYWRLARLRGQPESLARGLACGVFAGLFPFFGSQTLLAVLLAFLFRGNKILALVGPWISNPFTSLPIYAFNFYIGKWLLNDHTSSNINWRSWEDIKDIQELGIEIIWPLFIGCVVVGFVCAIISYFFGLRLIYRVRASHHARQQRKRMKYVHQQYPDPYT
ncbi:MAG TPA: DUF2062 domain-containing protein [Stenomitos sp.]